MKKTLTVNLGGTVFNIDEDAYRLLDNYLNNLKLHFRKHSSAEEIVDDIELRISELFAEKLQTGAQVITITDVEEVIARMGKPEDMDTDTEPSSDENTKTTGHRRFFRNPDDKMLGGVISGAAAYFGLNVTTLRLAMVFLLIFSFKILIPLYIICWIIVPEARTAAEKLSMRGEAVTVENIGKTVTDGFEKVGNGVNEYIRSDKPRSFSCIVGQCHSHRCRMDIENGTNCYCRYLQPCTLYLCRRLCCVAFHGYRYRHWRGSSIAVSVSYHRYHIAHLANVNYCHVHCRYPDAGHPFAGHCLWRLPLYAQVAGHGYRIKMDTVDSLGG